MKKVIYVVLIICFFGFLLKTCIKKDKGYDTIEADNYPPLEVIEYNLPQRYSLTKNGVDYLVSTSLLENSAET
jgi:hypothetical protein